MHSILRATILCLAFLSTALFVPMVHAQACAKIAGGGDTPNPLGGRAPIPWERISGYWLDQDGNQFFYRMEIIEEFKDGSRNVVVEVLDEQMTEVFASGVGFVRAGSWDLWARVKGDDIDFKIRIQAFFPKGSSNLSRRILRASVKDMNPGSGNCLNRHILRKVPGPELLSAGK